MKIASNNQPKMVNTKTFNIKFTSLQGELPIELKAFKQGFTEFVDQFMSKNPGYNVVMSVKNNKKNIQKLQMKGSLGLIGRDTTKTHLSDIKSLSDLKNMLLANHSGTQAIYDVFEEMGKYFKPFNDINKF